jgi:hypothetical protein
VIGNTFFVFVEPRLLATKENFGAQTMLCRTRSVDAQFPGFCHDVRVDRQRHRQTPRVRMKGALCVIHTYTMGYSM